MGLTKLAVSLFFFIPRLSVNLVLERMKTAAGRTG
jgi:hypothetical protein